MAPVGMTTSVEIPGMGSIPGMAKNISDVPNEVSPIESTIFLTVKFLTEGFFVRISRSICEVGITGTACDAVRAETTLTLFSARVGDFRDLSRDEVVTWGKSNTLGEAIA